LARKLRYLNQTIREEAMLGLPSIAMVGFGLAALVTRHWRCKIHRDARRNAMALNPVHLALDPERWGDHGENAHAKYLAHSALRKTAQENRFWEQMAGDFLEPEECSEAEFVSLHREAQDSSIRAAQRRQAFRVISNA
jgi:hypothetical protein